MLEITSSDTENSVQKKGLKEVHDTGVISSLIFLVLSIIGMFLLAKLLGV